MHTTNCHAGLPACRPGNNSRD